METYKLNRKKEKINIKNIDITKIKKIGLNGHGLVLKFKSNGRIKIINSREIFETLYIQSQQENDESVKARSYYIQQDKNGKNLKDERGKCIHVYTKKEDCFLNVKKLWFIDDEDFEKIYEYGKIHNILFYYFDNNFLENEKVV